MVSEDRSATLIGFVMAGDFDTNSDNIDVVVDVVHESAATERAGFDIVYVYAAHNIALSLASIPFQISIALGAAAAGIVRGRTLRSRRRRGRACRGPCPCRRFAVGSG